MGTTNKRTPGTQPIQRHKLHEWEKVVAGISARVWAVQKETEKLFDELQKAREELQVFAEEKKP